MNKPNIFEFASSEISQDAFLGWLISWAKLDCKEIDLGLHKLGKKFINSILIEANSQPLSDSYLLNVNLQKEKIDVFIEIYSNNEKVCILIEDKIHSSEHSNQLSSYLQKAENWNFDKIIGVYFKSGFQYDLKNVIKNNYIHFTVYKLEELFKYGKELNIRNNIYLDFKNNFKKLYSLHEENKYQYFNFDKLDVVNWNWWGWIGFFETYKKHFEAEWTSVKNNREGLLSFMIVKEFINTVENHEGKKFYPYLSLKYSLNGWFSISFRLGLDGNHQKKPSVRDKFYDIFSTELNKESIMNSKPRFRPAKESLEIIKIKSENLFITNEKDLVKLLVKLNKVRIRVINNWT